MAAIQNTTECLTRCCMLWEQYSYRKEEDSWLDKVKDDIKVKALSADEVYDPATWRRHRASTTWTYNWEHDEEEEDDNVDFELLYI